MGKITDIKHISKVLEDYKGEKIVVLCHGVFDLLHIGHIKYFEEAKSMGDVLVISITPDRFVNKGPHRPVFSEKFRAEAIAALGMVDYVVINEWPTAIETIKKTKPNIYVKGPDYKDYKQDITGNIKLEEDAVKSIGGEIKFTNNITFSSSNLINQNFSPFSDEQKGFLEGIKDKYSFATISRFIDNLKKLRVLLIGEVIIDEYVFCDTIGKSGKEPVLVNRKLNTEKYAGGILAVANHVSNFCQEAKIISYLGDRNDQKAFIKENLSSNIDIDHISKSDSPTIKKTRFIDNYTKTKTLGVYDLNDRLLNQFEEEQICFKIRNSIKEYDVVIVADYGHGLITPKIVNLLEKRSKYLAINTQLNAFNISFHTISKYQKTNFVCVHEGELRHDYRNRTDTVECLTLKLSKRIRSDVIVITRGKNGSLSYDKDGFHNCPAYATQVVDRVGAGDTLFAIASLCFAARVPTDLTLLIGNLAAAEMTSSIGTGIKLKKMNILKSIKSLLQ